MGSNFWRKKAVSEEKWLNLHSLQPYFPPVIDSDTDWTAGSFLERLDSLGVKTEPDDGVIFYNDGYSSGHFETIVKAPWKLNQTEINQMEI